MSRYRLPHGGHFSTDPALWARTDRPFRWSRSARPTAERLLDGIGGPSESGTYPKVCVGSTSAQEVAAVAGPRGWSIGPWGSGKPDRAGRAACRDDPRHRDGPMDRMGVRTADSPAPSGPRSGSRGRYLVTTWGDYVTHPGPAPRPPPAWPRSPAGTHRCPSGPSPPGSRS